MELGKVESALDNGHLWARMKNGRYWLARRNGKTKTWKRARTGEYRIPVKCGLYACGEVRHNSAVALPGMALRAEFLISEGNPNVTTQL